MRLGKVWASLSRVRYSFLVFCGIFGLSLVFSFLTTISLSSDVFANSYIIPEESVRMHTNNDVQMHNECEGSGDDEGSSSGGTCTMPSGDQITWIGDSYSVGAQSIIEEEFSGITFGGSVNDDGSYIQSCKFVATDTQCNANPTNPSGIKVLKKIIDEGDLKPYLVFALGTNGGWTDDYVNQFKDAMSSNDDTKVIFVNSKTQNNNFSESNRILKGLADSSDNYYLADWAEVAQDEWFEGDNDKVHPVSGDGYKTWVEIIKDAIPTNCSAGLVPESDTEAMVWNYFVRANIPGVSDNPAAIAGIMGNLYLESGLDPFIVSNSGYYGIHQTKNQDFIDAVNDAGLGQYWGNSSSASAEDIKKAIEIELDWIINNNTRFKRGGEAYSFLDNIDRVSEKEPENYSDLFLVAVEGAVGAAVPSAAQPLIDEGAMALEDEYFASANAGSQHKYQAAATRREHARRIYDQFANSGARPSRTNSNFSSTEALSGSGNVKYDMEDDNIETLARFAIWKAGKDGTGYADTLSSILDDFEAKFSDKKGDSDELMKYVRDRDDYKSFNRDVDADDIEPDSEQLRKAKEIIVDGLRTTSAAQEEVVGTRRTVSDACPSQSGGGSGIGKAEIARTAALMSWPVQSWQTGASDFESDRVGQCDGGSGYGWVTYVYNQPPCMSHARDLYQTAWDAMHRQGYFDMTMDCGFFVASVLHYLGIADESTTYKMTGQPTMAGSRGYYPGDLRESDEWEEIENHGESSLEPGDILINDGHVIIYVGARYGGDYGHFAHASRGTRVGEIGGADAVENYRIYRYTGDKLDDAGEDSGDVSANGLTKAQADKLANNYNTNKGDWSGYPNNIKVAHPSNYCIGDANNVCASPYSNCTLFSGFFAEMFWGVSQTGWPNGSLVVDKLAEMGFETGSDPKPYAIFSTTSFNGNDHTGVVVAVDGDKIATVEAGYPSSNAAWHDYASIRGHNIKFAYPKNMNLVKLKRFIDQ